MIVEEIFDKGQQTKNKKGFLLFMLILIHLYPSIFSFSKINSCDDFFNGFSLLDRIYFFVGCRESAKSFIVIVGSLGIMSNFFLRKNCQNRNWIGVKKTSRKTLREVRVP